jgi:pyruvate dehydrogenase kinase 2/3/4
MSWKKSERLMDTIKHYSAFPATGVSLRQMVQFGERPSTGILSAATRMGFGRVLYADMFQLGTLFKASQFLSEELPIRLAHRVQELGDLPDGLNEMPSIKKVQDWYAQSFEVTIFMCAVVRLSY